MSERDDYEKAYEKVRRKYERLNARYPINSEACLNATHDQVREVRRAHQAFYNFPDYSTWSNRRHRRAMKTRARGSR